MLWRDGPVALRLFSYHGPSGVGVALVASQQLSISFVWRSAHTSVANILLMQAGVPLNRALLGVVFLRERLDCEGHMGWRFLAVDRRYRLMVSRFPLRQCVLSLVDGLALLIAVAFFFARKKKKQLSLRRRYSDVRMTPAVWSRRDDRRGGRPMSLSSAFMVAVAISASVFCRGIQSGLRHGDVCHSARG